MLAAVLLNQLTREELGEMNVEQLAERVRAEFDEMPELVLTMPQASRFFGIDQDLMRSVTERLVASEQLRLTRAGEIRSFRS